MKKIAYWTFEIIKDFAKLILFLSFCLTAYSVYLTSKVNRSNYQLNQIRSVREGISYALDNKKPGSSRGIVLQQLASSGVSLSGLILNGIVLYGFRCDSDCNYLDFFDSKLKEASIYNTKFEKSSFRRSDLSKAFFIQDVFNGVSFSYTNLSDAIFFASVFNQVDFRKANLCGAVFVDSKINKSYFHDEGYYREKCGKNNFPCGDKKSKVLPICDAKKIMEIKKKYDYESL
ncbi:pentapeptide repeat-containing protein [Francisellaceae bacterium]|nr:pentapeptide repeat-containing protein [Francisellaceae bacterium]